MDNPAPWDCPVDDEVAAVAEATDRLTTLVDALSRSADAGFDGEAAVSLAVRTVPGARCADLLAWRSGELVSVAASTGYPSGLDAIRTAAAEGPCFEALDSWEPVVSAELAADDRWPRFGAKTAEDAGILSMVSYRVQVGPGETGVLSCYSDWPYRFDELAVTAGKIVAACCSLAALRAGMFAPTMVD